MTEDEKFDMFCKLAEEFEPACYEEIAGRVKAAMKIAEEDPENEIMTKIRVHQVLNGMCSRAHREVSAALRSTGIRII